MLLHLGRFAHPEGQFTKIYADTSDYFWFSLWLYVFVFLFALCIPVVGLYVQVWSDKRFARSEITVTKETRLNSA